MKKAKAKTRTKTKTKTKTENKSKGTSKKAVKKSVRKKKQVNPVEVRQDITNIVGSEVKEITKAVVDEAKKGQLAPVKYLFEVAGVYPPAPEANTERPEEDTLAQRLVRRLGLPEGPLPSNEDDDPPIRMVIPIAKSVGVEEKKLCEGLSREQGNESIPGLGKGNAKEENGEEQVAAESGDFAGH